MITETMALFAFLLLGLEIGIIFLLYKTSTIKKLAMGESGLIAVWVFACISIYLADTANILPKLVVRFLSAQYLE